MHRININTVLLFFFLVCLESCTREIPEPPATEYPDITGIFNGYEYTDKNGLVPLEIIEVKKTGPDEYTATKLLGDNAVPTGIVTWKGKYTGTSPFPATGTVGNGYSFFPVPCQIYVESKDILKLPQGSLVFIRRVDNYQP